MKTLEELRESKHYNEGFSRAMRSEFKRTAQKYNLNDKQKFVAFFYHRYADFNLPLFTMERNRVEQLAKIDKREVEKKNSCLGSTVKDAIQFFVDNRLRLITDKRLERLKLVSKIERYVGRVEQEHIKQAEQPALPAPEPAKPRFQL